MEIYFSIPNYLIIITITQLFIALIGCISHFKGSGLQISDSNGNGLPSNHSKEIQKHSTKPSVSTERVTTRSVAQTSVLQDTTQNGNITRPTSLNLRVHSQLYFSKPIIDSLPLQSISPNCAALSIHEQEQILIDELLYCFIGIPGDYIMPQTIEENERGFVKFSFKISDQVDVSLRNIVQDLIPMAGHYSAVQKFAQWGDKIKNQVLQALSEVIQTILNDYRLSITQLEKEKFNNNLTLHKLHYLIRPNAQKLNILAELVDKISKCDLKSGTILTLLFDEITLQTGDSMSQKMMIELTERASVPYIEMLERWILKGVIIDKCNQFFVVDHMKELLDQNSQMDTAHYWEKRYTIQADRIPRFLENDKDIILRAGKYLNVIRQCGQQIHPPANTSKMQFSATDHNHSLFIKQAYHNASKTLLELLVNENNLMGHISSVKRYFLLQQGDLITQFMDATEKELSKTVDKVFPLCLNNLLQLIVRFSSAKNDPCIEHLFCDLITMDLMEQMTKIHEAGHQNNVAVDITDGENFNLSGLECFAFGYAVEWPVSIVLNQWALSQYQMLFRLLFYTKHVERQFHKVWIENCKITKKMPKEEKLQWRTAFALRTRMINAIQHLENYMMIEIIEPTWRIFTDRMENVSNVDEVIKIHQDFLHTCLQNCCLNHPDILRCIMSICGVCLNFAKFIQSDDGNKVSNKWQAIINAFGKEFDKYLFQLLNTINGMSCEEMAGAKLINLVHRINFNGYYSERIEHRGTKKSPITIDS